ncbi:MAG TPA: carboxypeptidase-like regulatory domain-containing protein [Planctomycetota bacterium]
MHRIAAALAVLLLGALGWLLMQFGEEPLPANTGAEVANPVETATAPLAESAPLPAPRAMPPLDGSWWLANLTEDTRPPLAADEDDPTALVLRGRLTVRQRPWLHPAGIEIRLTRSWLDTVLPVEVGAPERREPTTTTDAEGRFVLRCRPDPGELFVLIDRNGPWMDFQKVPSQVTKYNPDLGEILVDDRGGIAGTLVDRRGQPVANASVRAVDAPLLDATSGLDDLRGERTKGLELFSASGSLRSGPIPDWVIRRDEFLPFPSTTTDAAGRFVLRGLRPGSHEVFCQHALAFGSRRDVLVAPLRDTEIGAITLTSTTLLALRFVDEADQPWVGAKVAFVHKTLGFGTPVQTTSAFGEVRATVPDEEAATIMFSMPGNGPWIAVDRAAGKETITVSRPGELTVFLADERGRSLANGSVRTYVTVDAFRKLDRALPPFMQPTERNPGRYVGLHPCSVVVVASVPGMAPGVAFAPHYQREITLTMLPLQTMSVRTHDLRGNPIADAKVRVQVHRNPDLEFVGSQWDTLANDRVLVGSTNEDGVLEIPVWPTFFSLEASHREFASSAGPKILASPGMRTNLMLKRRASLVGYLTMEQRPAPAGFRVRARLAPPFGTEIHGSGWLDAQLAVTGSDGSFAFRSLCSGIWELTPELPGVPSPGGASVPAEAFLKKQVLLDEEQEMHCVLEVKRSPLVRPQIMGVVSQNGAQLQGACVRLRELRQARKGEPERRPARRREAELRRRLREEIGESRTRELLGPDPDAPVAHDAEPSSWPHRITTDQFGDFSFSDLEPGAKYELRVDVPRAGRLQFVERRVVTAGPDARGEVTRVDIELTGGTIRVLCLKGGRPFANRMVRLRQVLEGGNEGARFDLLTQENGECIADGLPAGTWTVEPIHGGRFEPGTFKLGAGEASGAVMYFVD